MSEDESIPGVLTPGGQPIFTGRMEGIIVEFTKANTFKVRLDDGQTVPAVMPDELLPIARENLDILNDPRQRFLRVQIEFRQKPALQ